MTRLTSRIVHFPTKKFEKYHTDLLPKMAPPDTCPFCPQNIPTMTSKFERTLFGKERLKFGNVTVIPNLLTFDKYCVIAIISKEHFMDMADIVNKGYLVEGIRVLINILKRIAEKDRTVKYLSINCNYMPMSGSSILHPHVQAIAGEVGTNYHRMILKKSDLFFKKFGECYWDVLKDCEYEKGERVIWATENTFWYVPFAPKGNLDIGCIFNKTSILDLEEEDLNDFKEGLRKVVTYFKSENVPGFNLSFFSAMPNSGKSFKANLRILGRRFLPPLGAADTNYFYTLHMESTSVILPEEVAKEMKNICVE
ncbi:MAG: hypothetical protein N2513_07965 [Deltaproteobacteria bacterium]|nr:hypothetical protein [Deltaproteobacteria bacterium]